MSKCTVPGCTNEAVARGLCAMHYMRQRRHGDPEAAFKPGRPPKPHAEDPASAAVRRENAALREEIAALRRRLEEAQARPSAAARGGTNWSAAYTRLYGDHSRLTEENRKLKKQLAAQAGRG